MRACISISKLKLFLPLALLLWNAQPARAADPSPDAGGAPKADRTSQPEDRDYSDSPYTQYGEFDSDKEEADDIRFFQYGRFFGISIGVGFDGVTGNRGQLWQGGFPSVDLKVHYWFDFNWAIDLNLNWSSHYYDITKPLSEHRDITVFREGFDLKYYVPVQNASASLTFSNPYFLIGVGNFSKTETPLGGTADNDASIGFTGGLGLEFPIQARKVFFELEGRANLVTYKDTNTTRLQPQLTDLNGLFYSVTASLLFTW